MSDHADTIRRDAMTEHLLAYVKREPALVATAERILAERQQAIDERDRAQRIATESVKAIQKLDGQRQQAIDERDEALRRMDEALAKQYNANAAYEAKIQDLAQETLRNSELRGRCEQAIDALREIANLPLTDGGQTRAAAALLSLGEQK